MTPRTGSAAPLFEARSDDGRLIRLADLRGRWVVLYFYPRALTPGCSLEARQFEQALPQFQQLGAEVIGVSSDTEARQAQFRDRCGLSFPLLPDSDQRIVRLYGVQRWWPPLARRQTFVIDPAGLVAHCWRSVDPARHAGEVLTWLQHARQPAWVQPSGS
ncbi:peroxiredoxin [Deinococcus sonorensis]|uniref:thioredoxin-dependent peroxiredoxin n=2 Tax=Deinococcus sonorensis TaxID=309891 RepID=A0AAU7U873_9DEIO